MKRAISAISAAALVLFVAWCGGQDFEVRNIDLAMDVCIAIAAAAFAYTCPLWDQP